MNKSNKKIIQIITIFLMFVLTVQCTVVSAKYINEYSTTLQVSTSSFDVVCEIEQSQSNEFVLSVDNRKVSYNFKLINNGRTDAVCSGVMVTFPSIISDSILPQVNDTVAQSTSIVDNNKCYTFAPNTIILKNGGTKNQTLTLSIVSGFDFSEEVKIYGVKIYAIISNKGGE